MDRYSLNEQINLIGKLPNNAINARIYIWKTDMTLVINGEPITQLILGTFLYNFVATEMGYYIWQMKGTHPTKKRVHTFEGNFLYGGWVDSLLRQEHLDLLAKEITSQTIKAKTDTLTPGQEVVFVSRGLTVESHSVTDFYLGESVTIVAEVKFDTLPVSGATVTGDYYKPDNTVFLSNQPFTEIGNTGVYTHTFSVPTDADKGVYKVKIKATKTTGGGISYSEDFTTFDPADWGNTGGTYAVYDESPDPQGKVYRKTDYGGFMYAFSIAGGNLEDFTYQIKVRMDSQLPDGSNAGSDYVGITFRYADSNNNYDLYFRRDAGNIRLRKNGATLSETPSASAWNKDQWYTVKVVLTGGNIKVYVNDVLQIEHNDSNPLPAGKVGLFTYNSVGSWDDISVETTGVTTEAFVARDFQVRENDIAFIKKIEKGRWKINKNTNEMIFYDETDTSLVTFDLFDENGKPNYKNIFERKPK